MSRRRRDRDRIGAAAVRASVAAWAVRRGFPDISGLIVALRRGNPEELGRITIEGVSLAAAMQMVRDGVALPEPKQ